MRIYDDTPDGRYCNIRVQSEMGTTETTTGAEAPAVLILESRLSGCRRTSSLQNRNAFQSLQAWSTYQSPQNVWLGDSL